MNIRNFFVTVFIVTMSSHIAPSEYIYPIGSLIFEEREHLCLLHQKGIFLELLLWDPLTEKSMSGISHHIPAALVILPSKTGFSFVDHERIRIKMVAKRSPKTVDLYPLYEFGMIHWINDQNGYCSAKEGKYHSIFHITDEGDYYRLTPFSRCHYTYPQKIDSDLFYIKRTETGVYSIEKTHYPEAEINQCTTALQNLESSITEYSLKQLEQVEEEAKKLSFSGLGETLIQLHESGSMLSFLTMISKTEGYVLKHAEFPFTNEENHSMVFECWHLQKTSNSWAFEKLFSFEIPKEFLFGEKRLYESVLRVLPLYLQDEIYFVTRNNLGSMDVQRYVIADRTVTCSVRGKKQISCFTPCVFQNKLIYGGAVDRADSGEPGSPLIVFSDQESQRIFLP